ncbi:unnamed protein product [Lactuca virosa]|uniref:Uncharacterized protein n=1 Tax=Lactuca virosa TaxID=75947 RepID=A0AAU9NRP8_9ASTR|nr:unnamed protein product [Lactuca virosa]
MNEDQMRGQFKRLSENAKKWVEVYQEAWHRRRSGMSQKDIKNEVVYVASGNKFNDIIVFNGVMCKHEKWALELDCDTTRSRPECEVGNEESGGSTKRSRTTEEGEYCVLTQKRRLVMVQQLNIQQAEMRLKKGKGKAYNEIAT